MVADADSYTQGYFFLVSCSLHDGAASSYYIKLLFPLQITTVGSLYVLLKSFYQMMDSSCRQLWRKRPTVVQSNSFTGPPNWTLHTMVQLWLHFPVTLSPNWNFASPCHGFTSLYLTNCTFLFVCRIISFTACCEWFKCSVVVIDIWLSLLYVELCCSLPGSC